jgi:hypothetical protein
MLDTQPVMPTVAHKKKNKSDLTVPNSLAPLHAIRTETVFSRLPIHNLSKKGKIDIKIIRKNADGEVDLRWLVSHSNTYGEPKQLAYKIDTIIINRKLDELGRPLPRLICLGSLHAIAQELGFKRDTASIKKAILQNSALYITAKLKYTGTDGVEHPVMGGFNRYNVVFTGDLIPDGSGRIADAVYLVLNDPFWGVLNNAPTRPLDYEYLKILAPRAQRFYEIVSFKIYAAIKYRLSHAKLPYSEYCTYSAQQRYFDFDHVKKQMYKVHKPHLVSGYLADVSIKPITGNDGTPDWIMSYIPGPRARAEFKTFNDKRSKSPDTQEPDTVLPLETSEDSASDDTRRLVQYFHKRFHDTDITPPDPKDLEFAGALIAQYGMEKSRFVVEYSQEAAAATKYSPDMLIGIRKYVDAAIKKFDARAKHRQEEKRKAREEELHIQYERYCDHEIERIKSIMSADELAEMEKTIRVDLQAENIKQFAHGLETRHRMNKQLAARAGVLPYEAWREQQRNA